jgi:acetoin utilization deacetylase AcuC-like enzyme
MKIITDSRCLEYSQPGHPERPQRISRTVENLRQQKELPITWAEPAPVQETQLLRAHSPTLLARLKQTVDFDADSPAYPHIYDHAVRSVGGALQALHAARQKESAFSLMRPPGHHATRDRAMGFCYLGSAAIAVLEALAEGLTKVAVFDFDVHHCNGTEAILLKVPDCAVFSVHMYPGYPGTGTRSVENSFNYPVPPHTPRLEYRAVLETALHELQKYAPKLLVISAGFDAYHDDPVGQELLDVEDFHWLGESIRAFKVPTFGVMEGGYSDALPDLVLAYLRGLEGK